MGGYSYSNTYSTVSSPRTNFYNELDEIWSFNYCRLIKYHGRTPRVLRVSYAGRWNGALYATILRRTNDNITFIYRDGVWNFYLPVKTWYDSRLNTHRNLYKTRTNFYNELDEIWSFNYCRLIKYHGRTPRVLRVSYAGRWNDSCDAPIRRRTNDNIAFIYGDRLWNFYLPVKTWYDSRLNTHRNLCETNPYYTASFSTNELTLTASITSITNAHNSFAITLERDDGTVLQTHTLADGETSFTFTQTETSYATFNYVVKLNGTQTDTYSATYTPPPTPTFDIALTNDDLAITATLTNIVNPDPYYTLMIHDANDTHLDGHTFATGDTTVVLTWTETSYGEKTYTKLLNGASIGTETITLTDPNGSTPTFIPVQLDETGDTDLGRSYRHVSTSGTVYTFQLYNGTTADNAGAETYITYDTSDKKWRDAGTDHPNTFAVSSSSAYTTSGHSDPSVATGTDNAEYIHLVRNNGFQHLLTFKMAGWSSTPTSTLKWNFSDKHDGTAEGFSVHDDQTPPCYVEKASDGTWSLTLTGVLANRQDQSPGNNWDYIETTGGTVYLKYKNWDSGGYWSGPYTRAEWSSSIGSETIRIYEHSSYSEQYNNGIYLIQETPVPNTPPSNGENGYLITNTNNATSTLEIRANGSTFTFNSATCWYYDRKTSTGSWLLQKLGFVPSTNTFIEANISGNPDQVYHNKTSSNVIKDGITVIPNAFLVSNDPQSFSGAALFENPFTD